MLDTDLGSQRSQNANKTATMNSTAVYGDTPLSGVSPGPLRELRGAVHGLIELETCTKTLATSSHGD